MTLQTFGDNTVVADCGTVFIDVPDETWRDAQNIGNTAIVVVSDHDQAYTMTNNGQLLQTGGAGAWSMSNIAGWTGSDEVVVILADGSGLECGTIIL